MAANVLFSFLIGLAAVNIKGRGDTFTDFLIGLCPFEEYYFPYTIIIITICIFFHIGV